MKKTRTLFTLSGALICAALSSAAQAVVMDFEALETWSIGGKSVGTTVIEDGYRIDVISSQLSVFEDGWQSGRGASNGTNTMGSYHSTGSTGFALTSDSGSLFSLNSIDLAEIFKPTESAQIYNADRIEFSGTYADGSSIIDSFIFDTINDGPGGVEDFETYSFSSAWKDLISVSFIGYNDSTSTYFSFDNIVIDEQAVGVPLPPTLALFAIGLLGLTSLRRRSR